MRSRPDILVLSADDRVRLAVEVSAHPGASSEWAARFRRNLVDHSILPEAEYFLLALPDTFYLWRNARAPGEAGPEYQVPAADVLGPFGVSTLDGEGLEMAVNAWLHVLTRADLDRDEVARSHGWLVDSGLYDRIRGGHVELQAAA